MARRNPMNERYGKYTAPAGKTRRSASSAKPKRATGPTSSGSTAKKAAPAASKRVRLDLNPDTPEFKRLRTIWWIMLGSAMVFSVAAWWLWQETTQRTLGNFALGVGYALIFGAIFLDWTKLRPMRQAWMDAGGAAGAKKASKDKAPQDKS